jgi:hypothetical protein
VTLFWYWRLGEGELGKGTRMENEVIAGLGGRNSGVGMSMRKAYT